MTAGRGATSEACVAGAVTSTSVDPSEVAYYERLAHLWWDRTGPFWPLHRLNELRIGYIRDSACRHFGLDARAGRPLAGLRVLDIGCGGGILSESMARFGALVHGVDVTAKNVRVARQHAQENGVAVSYEETTVEALARRGEAYDLVLNMEVVEHVADLDGFLAACAATVRPGGQMVVATINRNPVSWLFAIVGAEYVLRWLPRGTHRWDRFRKPRELEAILQRHGLTATDAVGVRVNPLTRRFSLTAWQGVNFMMTFTRGAGVGEQAIGRGLEA